MVDASQLEKVEQVLKEKYNKYLIDKKELEEREANLRIKEETLIKDKETFKDDKRKFKRDAETKIKDIEADKEWLKKRRASLDKEKADAQRQRDNLEEERILFAQEKKEQEEKFLEGVSKNIADQEKNEAQKEEIKTWLQNADFYSKNIKDSLKILREELDRFLEKEKTIESLDDEISKKEKRKESINKEISKLEKKLNETQQNISILIHKKKKLAQVEHKIPNHEFKSEEALVRHIKKYIASRGFYYEDGVIENFYTSLKVGYLVILSGISGVGKSKLPQLFAEAIGAGFEMIPVRPDWNDDRDLLGFFNINTGQYQTTRLIEFLIDANQNRDRLYIVCLDEMNLAPVEYYFAQLLSQMENEEPRLNPPDEMFTEELMRQIEGEITLKWLQLSNDLENEKKSTSQDVIRGGIKQLEEKIERLSLYQNVPISPNIKFVGTVNMDHTTKGFSDKVLDRANVIQFENVNIWNELPKKRSFPAKGLKFEQFEQFNNLNEESQKIQNFIDDLKKISAILQGSGINIGFRVKSGIQEYMSLAIQGKYFASNRKIFDAQIKQRILPKIQGMKSKKLEQGLEELSSFLDNKNYLLSLDKVAGSEEKDGKRKGGLINQLQTKGYVNYWEVR